jgi:Mg2+ and Co2+ transporter CorA
MNVKLPLHASPYAFYVVIGVAAVFALLGLGFFIKKKWLD